MPSSPSSVIVVDDSSDDESLPQNIRQNVVLIVSSSDESDTDHLIPQKKLRVASPTAPKIGKEGHGSETEKDRNEASSTNDRDQDSGTCEQPTPYVKMATPVKKTSSTSQSSATMKSEDDTDEKTPPLRTAYSNVRMYSDCMSFSKLQAQQRELERLQAYAQRSSKLMPCNTAHRAATGSKRKASDPMSVTHSLQTESSVMMNIRSPLPFNVNFSESSNCSSSMSPEKKNDAAACSVQAKPMSLQDVVAQESELAKLRSENANNESHVISLNQNKILEPMTQSSVPRSSLSPFRDPKILVDGHGKSDHADTVEDAPFQPEPFSEESLSKSVCKSGNPRNPSLLDALGRASEPRRKRGKTDKAVFLKKSIKSKLKMRKIEPRTLSAKAAVRSSSTTQAGPFSEKLAHCRNARDTVIPGTVWRNVCFDTAPTNLLPLGLDISHPFCSAFDLPLLTYDVDGDLKSKCEILPLFGKPTQSVLPTLVSAETERVITQKDMETRVTELIQRELPRLRACHQRKATAILTEARAKVQMYLAAHETLKLPNMHLQTQRKRLCDEDVLTRSLRNQMKQEKPTQSLSLGYCNVRGETSNVEEKMFPQDVNQLPNIRPLSRCTTYIGVRANIRVEDDPILRYKPYFGEEDDGADIDQAWYDAISPMRSSLSIGLHGEVNEYLLRLVVHEFGITDNVFSALERVSGFAQAYLDYSEMKKLDDSICLAAWRIKNAKELIAKKPEGFPLAKVIALEPLLRDNSDCQKTLAERLAPPPTYFDSNLARHHSDRGYGLGLRSAENYSELLVTYRDMFCRMCYDYHCLQHGIEHPLPSHRVDPVNPPVHLSAVAFAALAKLQPSEDLRRTDRSSESCASTVSLPANTDASNSSSDAEENVQSDYTRSGYVHTGNSIFEEQGFRSANDGEVAVTERLHETRRSSRTLTRVCSLASRSLTKQGTRHSRKKHSGLHHIKMYPPVADESEYLDDSYYGHVTAIVKQSQQADERCSKECWKAEHSTAFADADYGSDELKRGLKSLSDTELTLLRKLRVIIGDNPCILSAMMKSTTCAEVGAFLELERNSKQICTGSMDGVPLSRGARSHNGRKRGRALDLRSSNNRILQKRSKNNRVNHEYEPCDHEGACDSTGCSCMMRDHTCDKACSCSRHCANRFVSRFIMQTELLLIGAFVYLDMATGSQGANAALETAEPRRAHVTSLRGSATLIFGVAYSTTHGWGAFALEPIKRGEFIYEYHGALLSQDEAERRGSIYDKMTISFLFDVDDDSVVDAIRKGNKSKFANHSTTNKKCKGKVLTVGGEHRISIWAQQDIAEGEELFFDYGYHGETAPDWS
ncbi:unnamed protein product [Peronospora belbahrii]|uniref:SET domain-containing protein n=1 Tax=Peronospora belbahrii TaxID=622444 RepID=A0AAU9KTV3_9STRA|nr:unnamed protein product [Peronospora belbahrii]